MKSSAAVALAREKSLAINAGASRLNSSAVEAALRLCISSPILSACAMRGFNSIEPVRASATGEVIFENCRLAPMQLLGKLNDGFVASLKVLELIKSAGELRRRLRDNTAFFRRQMTEAGFDILPGEHPIVPVMIGDASLAARMAEIMLEKGVYVIAFSYPVVPQGKARIRAQVSATHSAADLERAVKAFVETREALRQ